LARGGADTEVVEAQPKAVAAPLENLVTVSRTMAVFELLAGQTKGMTLSDIARYLDVNKSIAFRILSSLEQANYLFRSISTQRYLLTYKVSRIGLSVLVANRFMEQVQPRLRELADASGELVLLADVGADGPQWILAARGDAGRRLQVDPMIRSSLHSTATGKAWLSTLSDREVELRVGRKLPAATGKTVRTLAELKRQLAEIRAKGYSVSDQENEEGIKAISVPIRTDPAGTPVGFVSITAPVSRNTAHDFDRFRRLLLAAAASLGDTWPPQEAKDFSPSIAGGFQILD
jgi:IclR family transcriptional regulator, acetate operon repressor